eukprot:COSAG01_NODE_18722_length_1057_cov_48.164927_2_plen_129_part_00
MKTLPVSFSHYFSSEYDQSPMISLRAPRTGELEQAEQVAVKTASYRVAVAVKSAGIRCYTATTATQPLAVLTRTGELGGVLVLRQPPARGRALARRCAPGRAARGVHTPCHLVFLQTLDRTTSISPTQ